MTEGRRCKYCNWLITGVRRDRGYICAPCEDGRRKYNMDRLQMLDLLESQGGLCLCCGREIALHDGKKGKERNRENHLNLAVIDHVHYPNGYDPNQKVGAQDERHILGILCAPCNLFLGTHHEDKGESLPIDYATRVRDYLTKPPMIYQKMKRGEQSIIIEVENER